MSSYCRRLAFTVFAGLVLVVVLGQTTARAVAVAEPPVWKLLSTSDPTFLKPDSPANESQRLVVDATGGTYRLKAQSGGCKGSFEGSFGFQTTPPIAYNATASEVREALENPETFTFQRCFPPGSVEVTESSPGDYTITEMNEDGNQPEPLLGTEPSGLTGGSKTATVTELKRGAGEGYIVLTATNVGGTTDGSAITVEDSLPAGLIPTRITGYDAYQSGVATEGEGSAPMTCSPEPEVESPLRCTYSGVMITGDSLRIVVHVKVSSQQGEFPSHLSVSGGGAMPQAIDPPLVVSKASASYGPAPESVISAASTNQAGAHSSVTTAFTITTSEANYTTGSARDVAFEFPPGLVGSIADLPKCDSSALRKFKCSKASMVGAATIEIQPAQGTPPSVLVVPVYAIEPAPGEPVAFGFSALVTTVRLDTGVMSAGDYGVRVTASNLSQEAQIFSTWVTIWGVPGDHSAAGPYGFQGFGTGFGGTSSEQVRRPILTNPQQCGTPMQATMLTDSWEDPGAFQAESVGMPPLTGCGLLSLESSFTMLPDTLEAGAPAGYKFDLKVPQSNSPDALASSTVKTVKLALPVGTVVSPSAAWGLRACSDTEFGLHSGGLAGCPREAQVGTVTIKTPALLEPLTGQVYLASPLCDPCTPQDAQAGRMVRLFVQAVTEGESQIVVKLEGKASINQQTGQITTIFEENPPLPFDEFKLNLGGGPRATLANPRQCGPASTAMDMTPWSNPFIPDSTPEFSFEVNQGCFGEQFNPTVAAGTTSIQSGEYSPFTLSFGRSDQDGFLAGLQQQLPPGLLGKIAGVTLCGEPQASEGACPDNSLIGHVQALTGPGADPYLVTGGRIFLTGPYRGAPFGLSIVVPAAAGPYTLSGTTGHGTVVVRAAINVDPHDARLTVTADPLPTKLDGIPLQLKVVNVTVDRPGFTFNPTNCEKLAIKTTLSSQEGMVANVSTPFQVTNCVGLGFKPRFKVSTSGKTSRAKGASLDAKVVYPPGAKLANIAHVKVELPKQLPSRLTTLQKACPDSTFNANPQGCPAASRVGQARASTPVLPNELTGWVYFVSHGGAAFPNLVVVLQDQQDGIRVDLIGDTFISKAGITSTTFSNVPDVPISSFELYLPQGRDSALAANGNLCRSNLKMPTAFVGQNGAVLKQSTPITVTGCKKAVKTRKGHASKRRRPRHEKGHASRVRHRHDHGRSK
jgi:hypothetical protein